MGDADAQATASLSLADMAGNYVLDNLRSQLKAKTIRDTELSETSRALHEEVTVLVDELAKEKKARKRLEQQLDAERTKLLEMRSGYEAKGTQDAACKRQIYMLKNKLETAQAELDERTMSEKTALENIKGCDEKVREFTRQSKDLTFDILNKQKELEKTRAQNHKLVHTVKRVDASTRATEYEKRIEIQNLEKTYQFKSQEVDKLKVEYDSCDRNVKALTTIIKTGSDNFSNEKAVLMQALDESNSQGQLCSAEIGVAEKGYEKLQDTLQEGLAREKLLHQHLQDSAELRAELNTDLNEKQRQQAIYENTIKDKAKQKAKLLDELAEAKQSVALAREKLLNHEKALAVVTKEYSTAAERAKLLKKNANFNRMEDAVHQKKLEVHAAKQRELEKALEENEGTTSELQQKLIQAQTKIDILKQDRDETQKHKLEIEKLIDKHMNEGERLTKLLASRTVEWNNLKEQAQTKLTELQDTAESLRFANEKLDKALVQKERENENLALLENQVRTDREAENEDLKFRINEFNLRIGELHRELMNYAEKKRDFEVHLADLQPEVEKLEKMVAIKKKVLTSEKADQDQLVAERMLALENLVNAHEREVKETQALREQVQALTLKSDKLEDANADTEKEWRVQHMKTRALTDRFHEAKVLQSEYEASLDQLRAEAERVEDRLGELTQESVQLSEALAEANSEEELTKLKLRDQAVSRADFEKEMKAGKRAMHELEQQLKTKEGNFRVDAISVSQQINDLQSALVERVEGAERLTQNLQVSEAANENLRATLVSIHEDMEEAKYDSEKILEAKREDVAQLYATLGQIKVQEVTMQTSLARKRDEISQLELQLKMRNDKVIVCKNELDVTKDKINFLKLKSDRQKSKMSELQNTLSSKISMINLLQKQVDAKQQVQRSLEKQVRAIQHEKSLVQEKQDEVAEKHARFQKELEKMKVKFGERLVSQSEGPMALLIQHLKSRKAAENPLNKAYQTVAN